jgi:hypothetical protein
VLHGAGLRFGKVDKSVGKYQKTYVPVKIRFKYPVAQLVQVPEALSFLFVIAIQFRNYF